MRKFLIKIVSTFFYVGYLPAFPGTFGSLAGVGLYYLTRGSFFLCVVSAAVLIILGFVVSGKAERIFNKKDPRYIVIDEVAGIFLCLIFLPYGKITVILAFVIFRIFDALKPYPAGALQDLKGSSGVMLDDIIASLYTNIVLQVALRFANFKGS